MPYEQSPQPTPSEEAVLNDKEVQAVAVFHVFTDQRDGWYEHFDDAKAQFIEWGETFGRARLYRELQDEQGELLHEECLDGIGAYPL